MEVLKTNATSPLIPRRLISVLLQEKEKTSAIQKFKALRAEINLERRNDVDSDAARREVAICSRRVPESTLVLER